MKLVYAPSSLFGQLLAALLVAVGFSFVIIVALIVQERRELAFFGSETSDLVELVAVTSRALTALPMEVRAEELERLRGAELVLDRRSRSALPPRSPEESASIVRGVEARLARELGPGYRVSASPARSDSRATLRIRTERRESARSDSPEGAGASTLPEARTGANADGPSGTDGARGGGFGRGGRDGPGRDGRDGFRQGGFFGGFGGFAGGRGSPQIDVAVELPDGQTVSFRAELPHANPPLPTMIFFELGALTLVLGVVLFLMTRTITRPLAELASAADAVGRGERHSPLPETGARELRDATRAFNVMQERLHRYLDSRTRVLAAMSHDLRTPLTRLRLRTEALPEESLRVRFAADLEEMSSMIGSALKTFRGLDEQEPMSAVDVGDLLSTLETEFAEVGGSVSIIGRAARPIMARPQALKRCLTNLVSNAIKYGERATVTVQDGAALVIRVADDGSGIPEADLERVFEPFFRLEQSRNSETGGIGLGLGIARDIAQSHGGSLVLENRQPHGVEAILTLPRRKFAD